MLSVIERDKAKELMDNYFKLLSVSGNAKHPIVYKYLVWLYLLDFVERVYYLLTDEDYNKINDALICIFTGVGSCLLPYQYVGSKVTEGVPVYMGTFNLRITEDRMLRAAEQRLRIPETQDD